MAVNRRLLIGLIVFVAFTALAYGTLRFKRDTMVDFVITVAAIALLVCAARLRWLRLA